MRGKWDMAPRQIIYDRGVCLLNTYELRIDRGLLHKVWNKTGLLAILTRVFGAIFGIVTVFLIATLFSSKEQGYYYTFNSIVQLQVFFDAGIAFTLTQIASRYIGKFAEKVNENGVKSSDMAISALFVFSREFYSKSAIGFLIFVTVLGYIFFLFRHDDYIAWKLPWLLLVFATSCNLFTLPFFSIIEGTGGILKVTRMRLIQALISAPVLWTCLYLNLGLFSLGISVLSIFVVAALWIFINFDIFKYFSDIYRVYKPEIDDKNNVFGFQKKTSVGWLSGYFIYQIYNPIAFSTLGPETAGRIGLVMNLMISVGFLVSAYVNTKVPLLGNLTSQGNKLEFDLIFKKTSRNAIILGILSYLAIIFAVFAINKLGFSIRDRFLPEIIVIFATFWGLLNINYNLRMSYMRSFGRDDVYKLVAFTFVSCGIISFYSAKLFGVGGLIAIYTLAMLILNIALYSIQSKSDYWRDI